MSELLTLNVDEVGAHPKNVSREQLAGFVGKPENEWTAADLDGLVAAFQSLQAGTMSVAEMLGDA